MKGRYVKAKDLTHIKIKGTVHIWHCVRNTWKSLTNDRTLTDLEKVLDFRIEDMFWKVAITNGYMKENRPDYPDGFAVIDHQTKTGYYFAAEEGWTPEFEYSLAARGFLLKPKKSPSGFK